MEHAEETGSMAARRKYPQELKEGAVCMVGDIDERGAIKRVADQLDVNAVTLRNWAASRRTRGLKP